MVTKQIYTSGELCASLRRLEPPRRKAVVFMLESGLTVEDIICLRWSEFKHLKLTPFARAVAMSMPRYIHLDYVFWEAIESGQVTPLFGLRESLIEVFKIGPLELRELYMRMLWLDSAEDANEVREFLLEEMKTPIPQ